MAPSLRSSACNAVRAIGQCGGSLSARKGSGDALTVVGKELALDLSTCEFLPRVVVHVPGVANVAADILFRKHVPAKQPWSVPTLLHDVPEAKAPFRNSNWWRIYAQEKEIYARHANLKCWGFDSFWSDW